MKNLKHLLLLLAVFALQTSYSRAQSANTNQIGIRFGGFSGISFRHFAIIEEPYWPWDGGISLHYIF